MGFMGSSMVVDCHIEVGYCHTGGMPMSVHMFCLSSRRATARIHPDGRAEFRTDPCGSPIHAPHNVEWERGRAGGGGGVKIPSPHLHGERARVRGGSLRRRGICGCPSPRPFRHGEAMLRMGEGEEGDDPRRQNDKFMSLVLRHKPEEIGLVLDQQGWADIGELIEKAGRHGMALTRELIAEVVATSASSASPSTIAGKRIRANQGHSVDVDLGLAPSEPPPILFHGTGDNQSRRSAPRASSRGSGTRAPVAGRRHCHQGRPAARASRGAAHSSRAHAGERPCVFLSTNGVWLTEAVPVQFIVFPTRKPEETTHARRRAHRSQQAAANPRSRTGGSEGRRSARAGQGRRRVHERLSHHERRLAAAAADGAGPRGCRHRRGAGTRRQQRQEGRPRHLLVPAALRALPLLLEGAHRSVFRNNERPAGACTTARAREAQRRAGEPDGAHRHVLRIRGVPC